MAQQIGQLVSLETKTALPQHFDTSRMDDLMTRSDLTVAECDELRSMALAMPIENIPVETKELAKQLQFIEATLPSKNTDEQSGQMRTAVYARILGGYTKEALSYMTERVCKELDWFPTPRQCLAILEEYTAPTSKKDKALRIWLNHATERFDDFISKLHCGEPVELSDKPERWLRIAVERGYLRFVDGEYIIR
jgi:hypothetical protein